MHTEDVHSRDRCLLMLIFFRFPRRILRGIFFQNKVDYATWFGWRYDFIHGIQMLPVTPALRMIRTPEFCRQESGAVRKIFYSKRSLCFRGVCYVAFVVKTLGEFVTWSDMEAYGNFLLKFRSGTMSCRICL